jgi:D-aminopeptidase
LERQQRTNAVDNQAYVLYHQRLAAHELFVVTICWSLNRRAPMPPVERLRDFGVVIGTLPTGSSNTLTDVAGVRVGHTTLIRGEDVRTGVTAIWPHDGNPMAERLYAGIFALNGYGEMTSRSVIDEWGLLSSPIVLTGTSGVGTALHAATRYLARRYPQQAREEIPIAVVAECDDGFLHDHLTFALAEEDVWAALDSASTAPVEEGCVGAGTGMALFSFKGGIGSASRVVEIEAGRFTVGVLVETNFGRRPQLTIAGIPIGREITDLLPEQPTADGSCIVVVATDAPLHAHTLQRLAKRAGLGLARTGSTAGDGSGEIILAFSTAQRIPYRASGGRLNISLLSEGSYDNRGMNTIFDAVVEATEEAVINALLAATTMRGRNGHTLYALPHDRLRALLAR